MGYDQNKDKLIKLFEKKDDKSTLLVSVMTYNNGEPKMQISRSYEKIDGSLRHSGMGRLTMNEFKWIIEVSDEILKDMNK